MPKSKKNQENRTTFVPIEEQPHHYELHIGHHEEPGAVFQRGKTHDSGKKGNEKKAIQQRVSLGKRSEKSEEKSEEKSAKSGFGSRVWNFMEWTAMSALVFMGLFFLMNFGSYSQLIQTKWAKVTGTFELNPFLQQIVGTGEQPTQQLLPVAPENSRGAAQIPPVQGEVAPPDDRVIIPRINQNVPVVGVSTENLLRRDWSALENDIQDALKSGVVHYPGTAQPGDRGNVVITGHSSYFPWDPGRFKDVFALLHEVVVGDQIIVYHEQQKYLYEVTEKRVVSPDQIDVLTQAGDNKLTLITCTPVGTNINRLIVIARPVQS